MCDGCHDESSSGCGDGCSHPSALTDFGWSSAFSLGAPAFQLFGNVANFCIAPIAMGPPEIAPPGRFHPVPTNPVFAPVH
jgi:hypothetical protein